ncbi:hypothetical protein NLG97_g1185 [Lecanicillium saksenae]|uniref:Uncharacterized protein n=1 Tax=Lecanicillium saksenae TaxID=468837 RepID=A0ACC1R5S6_9HYPO|nr:hypothetical protein NLG97_g1185 [Lecanicillium saksenae]
MLYAMASLSSVWRKLSDSQLLNNTSTCPGRDPSAKVGRAPHEGMNAVLATVGSLSPLSQLLLFVYELFGERVGIDPPTLLAAVGFIWAFSKLLQQAYSVIESIIQRYLTSSIHITEDDQLYDYVMKFMSQHLAVQNTRRLTAETAYQGAWDTDGETPTTTFFCAAGGDADGSSAQYLNYSQQAVQTPPRFTPSHGQTVFRHKGRYFWFGRFKETFGDMSGYGLMKDIESISVSCYGRSTKPIKDLLEHSKALYWEELSQKTTIYRPRAKEMRRDYGIWQQVARRPVRPLQTVVLDNKKKHDILRDMNEYLHPTAPWWYASRGIPLRRGYLFHGPPGTGKTSFSFALAGIFGIDIYVISLQDGSITEEDLSTLFIKLPRRCVVLLEDIDSAGIHRDGKLSSYQEKNVGASEHLNTSFGENDAKDVEHVSSDCESSYQVESDTLSRSSRGAGSTRQDKSGRSGISLSGLLNAIDGVASHEGRILIMTTNTPESLDSALVRPGRVDMQVRFTMATQLQTQELFQRMYEPPTSLEPGKLATATDVEARRGNGLDAVLSAIAREAYCIDVNIARLSDMASEFAKQIPEEKFSPAEIQGFLLRRKKKSPQRFTRCSGMG